MAQHNEKKALDQIASLKNELRNLEDLHLRHEANKGRQEMDPEKMADRIKKLVMSADLSQQRCQNYEVKIKQLEGRKEGKTHKNKVHRFSSHLVRYLD